MAWTPGLDLETIRPGERKRGVGLLKRTLAKKLVRKGHAKVKADKALVRFLLPGSLLFNERTKRAVMVFQKRSGLAVDGVVGRSTWLALGFAEKDLMPEQLRGIPYPGGGVRPMDGNWVAIPLWNALVKARKSGLWFDQLNSGWRPDWYQKILWDAAVRRYGSEQAASKWVARPGSSKHRFSDQRGAVDVNGGETLAKHDAKTGLYRPMSWEPWHFQLTSAYKGKLLGRVNGEVADALRTAAEQRDAAAIPDGLDMDLVMAFVENELEELENDKGTPA